MMMSIMRELLACHQNPFTEMSAYTRTNRVIKILLPIIIYIPSFYFMETFDFDFWCGFIIIKNI